MTTQIQESVLDQADCEDRDCRTADEIITSEPKYSLIQDYEHTKRIFAYSISHPILSILGLQKIAVFLFLGYIENQLKAAWRKLAEIV